MSKEIIPYNYAKRNRVLWVETPEQKPQVLMQEPLKVEILQEVQRFLNQDYDLEIISEEAFEKALSEHYSDKRESSSEVFDSINFDEQQLNLNQISAALDEPSDLLSSEDDAPVIRLLNAIFFEAIREKASDIHIEPYETRLLIRFRLDGVLKTIITTNTKIAPFLATRIKVLSRLDIAEKRLPQDGRMSVKIGGRNVDMRISTIPSAYGERVVMRLLDKQGVKLDLDFLGMPLKMKQKLIEVIQKPHGIFLVTGPTGSGKTTTLYASLNKIDSSRLNVMTVEDPVEYYFEGISQTQVNTKANMDFARALRAMLRQDPDVVMVGEIRDAETAAIAVQASLTGHLVLSTLHTNTAVGAMTRLKDMGIEPFLLASTLQAVLAQRLVRCLCSNCKQAYEPSPKEKQLLNIPQSEVTQFYAAVGCKKCFQTGFTTRMGIFELVTVDSTVRKMIYETKTELEIESYIRTITPSLQDNAFALVRAGKTSLAEVLRVTSI